MNEETTSLSQASATHGQQAPGEKLVLSHWSKCEKTQQMERQRTGEGMCILEQLQTMRLHQLL